MNKRMMSLIWGIAVFVGMIIAFFPCLGWMNWLVIPLAIAGVVISAVVLSKEEDRTFPVIGLVLSIMSVVLGSFRLIMGAGIM